MSRLSWHFTDKSLFSPGFWFSDWGDPDCETIVTLAEALALAESPMWCLHEHGLVLLRIVEAARELEIELAEALSDRKDGPRLLAVDSPLAHTISSAYRSLHFTSAMLIEALAGAVGTEVETLLRADRDEAASLCLVMAQASQLGRQLRLRLPDEI